MVFEISKLKFSIAVFMKCDATCELPFSSVSWCCLNWTCSRVKVTVINVQNRQKPPIYCRNTDNRWEFRDGSWISEISVKSYLLGSKRGPLSPLSNICVFSHFYLLPDPRFLSPPVCAFGWFFALASVILWCLDLCLPCLSQAASRLMLLTRLFRGRETKKLETKNIQL